MEILQIKTYKNRNKNVFDGLISWVKKPRKLWINFKIGQQKLHKFEEKRKANSIHDLQYNIKWYSIHIIVIPAEEESEKRRMFEDIMALKFLKLVTNTKPQN